MSKKVFVLLSMEPAFVERFRSFLNNFNAVNTDKVPIVIVEDAYTAEYVAVPKGADIDQTDADVC